MHQATAAHTREASALRIKSRYTVAHITYVTFESSCGCLIGIAGHNGAQELHNNIAQANAPLAAHGLADSEASAAAHSKVDQYAFDYVAGRNLTSIL